MGEIGKKTTREYWEGFHSARPRLRLPSKLVITTRNVTHLLDSNVKPGMHVLEIGFAPGKILSYVNKVLGAAVTGLDYSEHGTAMARELFDALDVDGEILCEDVFNSSLEKDTFDVIYSIGVIEHFDDPRPLVRKHIEFLKRGGKAIIMIPNYRSIYGGLQKYFYPENLDIHNLDIMSEADILKLVPDDIPCQVISYRYGRIDPSQVTPSRRWPAIMSRLFSYGCTVLGHLQPFRIRSLAPWIVLEVTKN